MNELLNLAGRLGPWAATAIAITIAVLTHKRASKAQADNIEIERIKLVQDAYQELLDRFQNEIQRINDEWEREQGRWEERERTLRERVAELRMTLYEEEKKVERLTLRTEALEAELAKVEKRRGFWNEQHPEDKIETERESDDEEGESGAH